MASAVIGALRINLGINTAQFKEGLADLSKTLGTVGKKMQGIGTTMSAAVTAPLAAFGALTIKTAGDFEASMNRVEAATGATAEEIKAMRDMAVQLGADTSFSASESADAMEMLAKNGLAASQILDGAVSASMSLAAASGSDLSSAADVATDVMMNFGKEAKELGGLVDGITGVLLQSKFGFDDYRLAIGQAGGVAGNLGVTFEDFNTVIAATSSAFASGSDAGTSFKTFLTRLVPVSKTAAAAMDELGLEFFNADGSMKSMSAIADELRSKMAGLSDQDLNTAMKDIFGVDAMRTAIMLMKQGGDGLDAMRAKIAEASAEEQAAARLKGFNGELEKLSGAFETLQIAIADSGLLGMVTSFVSRVAEWVDALAETNPQLLKMGVVIGGLAAALGPVVLTLGTLAVGISAVGAPVAAVVAGLAALTAGLIAFAPQVNAVQAAIEGWISAGWNSLKTAINDTQAGIENFASQIVNVFANLPAQMMQIGGQIIDGLRQGLQAKWEGVKAWFASLGEAIPQWVRDKLGIQSPSKVFHEIGTNIMQGLSNGMQSMAGSVAGGAGTIADDLQNAFSGIGSSIGEAVKGTREWSDVLKDVLGQIAKIALSKVNFGGGFGGFLSGIFGGLFGFANGGSFKVGGAGGIDSQLVAFRASPNETVSVTKPGQERSGGVADVRVYVDQDGNWQAAVERIAEGPAARAAETVANSVPTLVDARTDERQYRRLRPRSAF